MTPLLELIARIVLFVLSALFGLKLLWNLLVPTIGLRDLLRGEEPHAVSLMPYIDVGLLILMFLTSFPSHDGFLTPAFVGLGGLAALVMSYLLMPVVGLFVRAYVRRATNRR